MEKFRKEADSYYGFDDENRAFVAKRYDMPQAWLNYLTNGKFHAFISQAGGGFAWWRSPCSCRITRYRQYNMPLDSPGPYVYIKSENGNVWSPTGRPCSTKLDSWKCEHLPGKSRFTASLDGVEAQVTYFVAPEKNVLVWDIALRSVDGREHKIDIYAYCEYSQFHWDGEACWGYYTRLQLESFYNKDLDCLDYINHVGFPDDWKWLSPLVYLASTEKTVAYCCSRNKFFGNYRDEGNPLSVHQATLGNDELYSGEACHALQNKVTVSADGSKYSMAYFLGVSEGVLENMKDCRARMAKVLTDLRTDKGWKKQESILDEKWMKLFACQQCRLPDPVATRQINTWNVLNSQVTAQFSRSVNQEAPGIRAVGYRDTCQDMISAAMREPDRAFEMLCFLLSYQFDSGLTVHACHKDEWGDPWLGEHSDDHLWMQMTAYAIAAENGGKDFFTKEIPYYKSEKKGTVWDHLMQAIEFSQSHRGKHGILLTLDSDWNDIIGRFNKRGEGESVFVSQQYCYVLKLMIEMADVFGRTEDAAKLREYYDGMVKAVNDTCWDGQWWRRGFDDDGVPVGGDNCECGKIFLNPQSWSVLGGCGTEEQNRKGLDMAYEKLNTGIGLQLMAPGFSGWDQKPGETPIGYLPGCGENGAIFCHANTWAVIAEALMGNGDRAWEYFTQLIGDNIIGKIGIDRYRAEPYAWCSNIVGPDNKEFGWGNVTQITGTAPWMDVASTQYLLGMRPTLKGLLLAPCLPSAWTHVSMFRVYAGCRVDIAVDKAVGPGRTLVSFEVDGQNHALTDGKALLERSFLEGKQHVSVRLTYKD